MILDLPKDAFRHVVTFLSWKELVKLTQAAKCFAKMTFKSTTLTIPKWSYDLNRWYYLMDEGKRQDGWHYFVRKHMRPTTVLLDNTLPIWFESIDKLVVRTIPQKNMPGYVSKLTIIDNGFGRRYDLEDLAEQLESVSVGRVEAHVQFAMAQTLKMLAVKTGLAKISVRDCGSLFFGSTGTTPQVLCAAKEIVLHADGIVSGVLSLLCAEECDREAMLLFITRLRNYCPLAGHIVMVTTVCYRWTTITDIRIDGLGMKSTIHSVGPDSKHLLFTEDVKNIV